MLQRFRIQAVLPFGTKTNFFNVAGTPFETMPKERQQQMMSSQDLVDSTLAGLDLSEFIIIPALPDLTIGNAMRKPVSI